MKNKNFRFYNFNTDNSLHHSLRLFGVGCWAFYYHNRFGWFRLFGCGLKWKDITIHPLTFSERNKLKRGIKIGRWFIGFLRNNKSI